jgi:diphthamide biosynthesis enzyme Dph1/Dph2-like protein
LGVNHNKRLMQRYSMISQLDDHQVFGIIVSNTSTIFHQRALLRCQDVLKRHSKKTFTFMMSTSDPT